MCVGEDENRQRHLQREVQYFLETKTEIIYSQWVFFGGLADAIFTAHKSEGTPVVDCDQMFYEQSRTLFSPRGSQLISLLCPALGLAALCLYPAGILLWRSLGDGERARGTWMSLEIKLCLCSFPFSRTWSCQLLVLKWWHSLGQYLKTLKSNFYIFLLVLRLKRYKIMNIVLTEDFLYLHVLFAFIFI